jgi:hypothetical protein
MSTLIKAILPALFGFTGYDLCVMDGAYTYWILTAVYSIVPY